MKKNKLPVCPYCSRKLTFWKAWNIHTKANFICPNCSYVSEVRIKEELKRKAIIAAVISIILILVFSIVGRIRTWEIIISIVPFIVFYMTVPSNLVLIKKDQVQAELPKAVQAQRKKAGHSATRINQRDTSPPPRGNRYLGKDEGFKTNVDNGIGDTTVIQEISDEDFERLINERE